MSADTSVRRRSEILVLNAAIACAVAGCSSSSDAGAVRPPGPWVTWQSGHVTVHARPDDAFACSTQVDEIETDLATIWDYFGVPDAQRSSVEWYRFRDAADWDGKPAGLCSDEQALGCEHGGMLFAPLDTFEHELVHAALHGLGGPPRLFTEGVAVALTCSPREGKLPGAASDRWADLLDAATNPDGAELVMHLLREYGPDPFRELYATLERLATPSEVAAEFQRIYGASLDDVWAAALADPNRRYCAPFLACQSPVTPAGDVDLGPRCESLRTGVRLPSDGGMSLVAQSGTAIVRPCDGISADYTSPPEGLVGTRDAETWFFPEGRDFALQEWGEDATATFSVRPLAATLGTDCTAPSITTVDGTPWQRRFWMPPVDQPRILAFQVTAPTAVSWSSPTESLLPGQDPWTIDACTTCTSGVLGGCTAYLSTTTSDRVWLRATWQPTEELRTLRADLDFE